MPSIADVYLTVIPETRQVADGIARALREADPKVAEAGRRWGQELERGMGKPKVTPEADTRRAEEELNRTARDRKSKIKPEADTAKAKEEIDRTARDRTAKVKVEVDHREADKLLSLVSAGQHKQASALVDMFSARSVLKGLNPADDIVKWAGAAAQFQQAGQNAAQAMSQGVQSGMGQFTNVASQVGGQVGSIISAVATPIIIGGLALAIGGVVSSLSGGLGLIPGALAGGGALFGTLALGLDGVKDAWDAAGKAADGSGKEQASQAKAVASAQKELRSAVQDESQAQKDVANARKDALRQLRDLNLELSGGKLDERQAILDVQAAERDLQTGRFRDRIEYEQAQLRVDEAEQRLAETRQRNTDLVQKANDAQAAGVDNAPNVVAANQRLAQSHERVAEAQQSINEAQSQAGSSAEAAAAAMAKLSPNAQSFLNTLMSMKPAFQDFKNSVQDALFVNMGPMFQQLATTYLPMLQTSLSQMATLVNQAFGQIANLLTQPATMTAIQTILTNVNTAFQQFTPTILTLTDAFIQMSSVGSGFLPQFGQIINQIATEFANWVNGPDFGAFIQDGLNALSQMVPIMFSFLGIFRDLAPIGPPVLKAISDILQAMGPYIPGLAFAFGDLVTQIAPLLPSIATFTTGFLTSMIFTFSRMIEGVRDIIHWISDLVGKFETGWNRISGVVSAVWSIIGPILEKISGALSRVSGPLGTMANIAERLGITSPSSGTTNVDLGGTFILGPAPAPTTSGHKLFDWPGAPTTPSGVGWGGAWGGASKTIPVTPSGLPTTITPSGLPTGLPDAHGANSQIAAIAAIAKSQFGLELTAGRDDHADDGGFHPKGMAGDFSNSSGNSVQELLFAKYMAENYGPYLQELIYSDPQFSGLIGGGKNVSGTGYYSPGVLAEHRNHVHVAVTQPIPGLGSAPIAAAPTSLSTGSSKAQIAQAIYSGLVNAGYSPETATAAVASSLLESGLNPNVTNASGHNSLFQTSRDKGIPNDPAAQIQWWLKEAGAQGGPAAANADPFNFIADKVERGGYPGSDYKKFLGEAQSLIGQGIPSGLSPQLGTQQSPMFVDYGPSSQFGKQSGGEQLGQDIFSGIAQIFGFDGSLFKDPTSMGGFKLFKGLMGALTGGGNKQGMPASYYAGGDGASLASPGGGDMLGGAVSVLQGIIPQPFGELMPGSPGQAPGQYQPLLPGSGFTPNATRGPIDNSITVNTTGTVQQGLDAAHQANIPRMRQGLRNLP